MLPKSGINKVMYGKTLRHTISRFSEVLEVPNLLDIQRDSFRNFCTSGIASILDEFNPVTDYSGRVEMLFLEHKIADEGKFDEAECIRRGQMYVKPLKVKVRMIVKDTGETIDQEVFLGDIPMMTDSGYFIVNGVTRVVVNQIIKSPNVYYNSEIDKNGKTLFDCVLTPTHGAYIEMKTDSNDIISVYPNRTNRISLGIFLKALGVGDDAAILKIFNNNPYIKATLEKDTIKTREDALLEISRKMRPSELPNAEAMANGLAQMFFTFPNYDLGTVGRYKFNKKLRLSTRIFGKISVEDIKIGTETIVKKDAEISLEAALKIQNSGINEVLVYNEEGKVVQVIGNGRIDINDVLNTTSEVSGFSELVHYKTFLEVTKNAKTKDAKIAACKENAKILLGRQLFIDDVIASVSYLLNLNDHLGMTDNIDHLGNRRLNTVGDLMQRHFKEGMLKLRNTMRETMQTMEISTKTITPGSVINAKAITRSLRDFLATGQLSQVMDTRNPLTEITQKRKVSSAGPGGITRERATAEVRDLHYTHNGRVCAIETPEGQSIGLVNSLAMFAKINEHGFITAPFRRVDKKTGKISDKIDYLTADECDSFYIAQATEPLTADGKFANKRAVCRRRNFIMDMPVERVDYVDASPRQSFSLATNLIPFLENDDTTRALLASNMQRQAVPLIRTEVPLIATGLEHRAALDSNVLIIAKNDGVVSNVNGDQITITCENGKKDVYNLQKFVKLNEETCINQTPAVKKGDKIKKGDVLSDGYATKDGELAIGKNMCVAYMNWEGYNFEDAILISERVVKDDKFTSISLSLKECKARMTKLGVEEITRDIPNLSEEALANLDDNGIIRVGATVKAGDILVGKVTPKGETELTPEERLLRAIFGEKAREVRDSSMRVENGKDGIVVAVEVFSRKNKDEMEVGVEQVVKVTIAQKRNVKVGDKMTGRHGNKGIVSKVLPVEDMPFMADGTPIDIVLNPLGVPSRLNIGQLLEVHLGLVAKRLDWKIATPTFNGATEKDIQILFKENGISPDGKTQLYDGRTGEPFEQKTTVGYMYMLKLHHMVDTKIHARSTGGYSLVTQQPLGGKAQFGGQRVGEMEVWALEAYGAAHILQEMLTVKSDDVLGRTKTYISIVNGQPIPEPGIPEGTKVMIRELQGLGMDVSIFTGDKRQVEISEVEATEPDILENLPVEQEKLEEIELGFDDKTEEAPSGNDDLDDLFNLE